MIKVILLKISHFFLTIWRVKTLVPVCMMTHRTNHFQWVHKTSKTRFRSWCTPGHTSNKIISPINALDPTCYTSRTINFCFWMSIKPAFFFRYTRTFCFCITIIGGIYKRSLKSQKQKHQYTGHLNQWYIKFDFGNLNHKLRHIYSSGYNH